MFGLGNGDDLREFDRDLPPTPTPQNNQKYYYLNKNKKGGTFDFSACHDSVSSTRSTISHACAKKESVQEKTGRLGNSRGKPLAWTAAPQYNPRVLKIASGQAPKRSCVSGSASSKRQNETYPSSHREADGRQHVPLQGRHTRDRDRGHSNRT